MALQYIIVIHMNVIPWLLFCMMLNLFDFSQGLGGTVAVNANNTLTLGGAATPTSPQQLTAINLCNQQSMQQNIGGTQIFTGQ